MAEQIHINWEEKQQELYYPDKIYLFIYFVQQINAKDAKEGNSKPLYIYEVEEEQTHCKIPMAIPTYCDNI